MFHTCGVGTVITLLWYLTWIMTSRLVFSQETCSCSPLVYQWTLDFSNSCNFSSQGNANGEIGIAVGPQEGVQSATCSVKIEKPTVAVTEESLQPVLVKGFQFVELGANLQRIKVMSNPLNFVPLLDGGVLEFTSEAASGMEMPSALIAFVFAENKDGDDIQLEWLIRFSTLCDVVPFQVGDSLGWMTFSGVTSARDETCKLASNVPTVVPSPLPTASPSLMPSNLMSSANNVLFTTNPNTMASASPTFLLTEQNSSPTAAAAATDTTTIDTTPSVVPSMAPSSPKWSKGTRSKSGKSSSSSSSSSSKSSKNRSHSKSSSSKSASSKKSKKAKSTSGKSQKSQKRKKSVKSKSEKHVKHVKIQKSKEFNNRSLRGSLIPSSRRQLR